MSKKNLILKCSTNANNDHHKYDGICSFDYDGTVGKQTKDAADKCRAMNYAVYGLSAGGHQNCLNSDTGPNQSKNGNGWDAIGFADFVGKGNGGNPKGHSIAQLLTENNTKFDSNITNIPIIHFDDGEGCNSIKKGLRPENCLESKHYAGRVNRDVLYYDYHNTTPPKAPYDKLNACIFQSGQDKINTEMLDFALHNKGPNVFKEYNNGVYDKTTEYRSPFLLCNENSTKYNYPNNRNVYLENVRTGVGII